MPYRIEVIDRTYAAILASKTPAERIAMADASHRTARTLLHQRILQLHPEWSVERRRGEYLRRLLGHGADGYLAARRDGA